MKRAFWMMLLLCAAWCWSPAALYADGNADPPLVTHHVPDQHHAPCPCPGPCPRPPLSIPIVVPEPPRPHMLPPLIVEPQPTPQLAPDRAAYESHVFWEIMAEKLVGVVTLLVVVLLIYIGFKACGAFLLLAAFAGFAAPLYADGVVASPGGTRPVTQLVGGGQPIEAAPVMSELVTVPSDDGGRWQVLLFTNQNCPACRSLEAAWKASPNLNALAGFNERTGWADLVKYDSGQASQAFRFRDYEVTACPTIVVTPPPTTKAVPYVQVFRREGWDDDPDTLAHDMVEAITRFSAKYEAANRRPDPSPSPSPSPWHAQPALPVPLPNLLPVVRPNRDPNFPPPQPLRTIAWEFLAPHVQHWLLGLLLLLLLLYVLSRRKAQPAAGIGHVDRVAPAAAPQPAMAPGQWRPSDRAGVAVGLAQSADAQRTEAMTQAEKSFEQAATEISAELATLKAQRQAMPATPPTS